MGSSISPILAEIFMNDFENSRYRGMIKYWTRYADDSFIVWLRTDNQIDPFPEEANVMYTKT